MTMSQAEAKQKDQLHRQLQHLEDDWNCYKRQSVPRHRRRCSITDASTFTTADLIKLIIHVSPKQLISSLQQQQLPSEQSMRRVGVRAVEEVVTERRVAMRSGKLRGRRLLDALESAKDEDEVGLHGREETCRLDSSALTRGEEVSPSSFCSSSVGEHNCYQNEYISSCSSPSSLKNVEVEKDERQVRCGGDGGRWTVLVAIVVLAFCLISLSEFDMKGKRGNYMTPT